MQKRFFVFTRSCAHAKRWILLVRLHIYITCNESERYELTTKHDGDSETKSPTCVGVKSSKSLPFIIHFSERVHGCCLSCASLWLCRRTALQIHTIGPLRSVVLHSPKPERKNHLRSHTNLARFLRSPFSSLCFSLQKISGSSLVFSSTLAALPFFFHYLVRFSSSSSSLCLPLHRSHHQLFLLLLLLLLPLAHIDSLLSVRHGLKKSDRCAMKFLLQLTLSLRGEEGGMTGRGRCGGGDAPFLITPQVRPSFCWLHAQLMNYVHTSWPFCCARPFIGCDQWIFTGCTQLMSFCSFLCKKWCLCCYCHHEKSTCSMKIECAKAR